MLREADLWCAIAVYEGLADEEELSGALKDLWIRMMFLQFHDILPGTSIEKVNSEVLAEFGKVMAEASALAVRAKRLILHGEDAVWNPVALERSAGRKGDVPSCGYICTEKGTDDAAEEEERPDCFTLEDGSVVMSNGILTAVVDPKGRLISCILGEKEYLSGPANSFRLYKDISRQSG